MKLTLTGHPLHTRSLTVVISPVEESLWHARGEIIDLRKCSFIPMMSDIQPAGIIHHMRIELTIDPASLRIEGVVVDQPVVAIEASAETGGECCRNPAPLLEEFNGEVLDEGFAKRLLAGFGGALGCSHLLTLFQLMASAIRRGARLERLRWEVSPDPRDAGERFFRRSVLIDGVERTDGTIGLGVQLGDFLTQPSARVVRPLERLAREDAVRIGTWVDTPGMELRDLEAATRTRHGDRIGDAAWESRNDVVARFEGLSSVGRVAPHFIAALGGDERHELLLAALLQLAPTNIQVLAATVERYFTAPDEPSSPATRASRDIASASFGGMADSCYM